MNKDIINLLINKINEFILICKYDDSLYDTLEYISCKHHKQYEVFINNEEFYIDYYKYNFHVSFDLLVDEYYTEGDYLTAPSYDINTRLKIKSISYYIINGEDENDYNLSDDEIKYIQMRLN